MRQPRSPLLYVVGWIAKQNVDRFKHIAISNHDNTTTKHKRERSGDAGERRYVRVLQRPRFHGPGLHLGPAKKSFIATGIVNAKYAPVAPILKMAAIARGPAKMRQSTATWTMKLKMTALIGVCVCSFGRC